MKKGLGRGVGALLGESAVSMGLSEEKQDVRKLPLQKVEPNPGQPRKQFDPDELDALAESIRLHGLIQPLTVRQAADGYYQIIAGERRWRAARMAGLDEVPVVVLDVDDKEAMELALIENLQRSDLNPIEEALGYRQLMDDYQMTQEEAATRVGKSRPAVTNALRLLGLSPKVLELVRSGKLSAGHGRALLTLTAPDAQYAIAVKVMNLQLSVRQTEAMCRSLTKSEKPKPAQREPVVNYLAECEKTLTRGLGRGVKIVPGKKKGRVELEYYGDDDLQRLYELLEKLYQEGR